MWPVAQHAATGLLIAATRLRLWSGSRGPNMLARPRPPSTSDPYVRSQIGVGVLPALADSHERDGTMAVTYLDPTALRDFETLGTYNRTHAGKAWSIVAMTTGNGGVYCPDCWGFDAELDDGGTPVFQSDEHYLACDECGEMVEFADPSLVAH